MNLRTAGLTYKKASQRGLALIKDAAITSNWHGILDELIELRDIMQLEKKLGDAAMGN